MPAREKRTYTIQAVERALDILETLCHLEGEVSIQQLSDKLEMNKSSVFRMLATFEQRGYLKVAGQTASSRLGYLGYFISAPTHPVRNLKPY